MNRHLESTGLEFMRQIAAVVTLVLTVGLAGASAPSAGAAIATCSGTGGTFAGGAGTSADPYLVSNQAQLETIRTSTYLACAFRQTADIALAGTWTPIGEATVFPVNKNFKGEYDGNGKTISGLNVTGDNLGYAGLFGYAYDPAIISNLFVTGSVTSNVGGFGLGAIGMADSGTVIRNVHADVDVTATDGSILGGLVGWGPEATIEESSAVGDVVGSQSVGGLVGQLYGRTFGAPPSRATVTDSYATGNVTGSSTGQGIGGLVGSLQGNDNRIIRSYATGLVTGGTSGSGTSGGLIGPASGGGSYSGLTVTDSLWDTETTGKSTSADDLGTGKTTSEMKSLSTFTAASWDITDGWSASSVWGICDGSTYPFLSDQYTSSPCAPPPPSSHILSVTKSASATGTGTVTSSPSGIDCGSTCEYAFNAGEVVTLTATPSSGSTFSGWSGSGCSGTGTCEVTMSEARSVDAAFTADPPTPSGKPNLKVTFNTPKKVTGGKPFDVEVKVTNRASKEAVSRLASARAVRSTSAKSVKTCLKVPSPLITMRAKGAKINGRTACWNRSSLGSGRSVTYSATLKAPRSASGSESLRATVEADNASGQSSSSSGRAKITVKKGKAPKPKPPTG